MKANLVNIIIPRNPVVLPSPSPFFQQKSALKYHLCIGQFLDIKTPNGRKDMPYQKHVSP